MNQRGVRFKDLRCALMNAQTCSPDGERWKVAGADTDGDDLTCIVVIEAGVVVVTVF